MARIPIAERRSQLIEAAVQVIATQGIDNATTRRIAEQAESPLTMLHYCYDTKEDLFADVYAYVNRRYREVLVGSDPHADLATTARQLARAIMTFYLDTPDVAATIVELISWARRQHEDRGVAVYNQALDAAREVLGDAAAKEGVSAETIDELAYVVAAVTDGFGLNWLTYGDRSAAAQQMEICMSLVDAWLAAHLAPPAKRSVKSQRKVG
ncbi:MAG TPA: TetR/AcrR family transcriptional regulator [Nocardioidaceae bacterium]|nr:TetR/AcrR family transcriptional regulator [Nocardioidaceae bacterium]